MLLDQNRTFGFIKNEWCLSCILLSLFHEYCYPKYSVENVDITNDPVRALRWRSDEKMASVI